MTRTNQSFFEHNTFFDDYNQYIFLFTGENINLQDDLQDCIEIPRMIQRTAVPFQCSMCDSRFTSPRKLKLYDAFSHGGPKLFIVISVKNHLQSRVILTKPVETFHRRSTTIMMLAKAIKRYTSPLPNSKSSLKDKI